MKNYFKKIYDLISSLLAGLLFLLLKLAPIEYYQPIYGANRKNVVRSCEDRWDVIAKHLDQSPGSVFDMGCNLGYFSFRAAEAGKMAFGVDADPFYILACQAIKSAADSKDAFFIRAIVTKSFLLNMPEFNTVFNFSVFHHWVKAYGKDEAVEMMKILSSKTKVMFFETGQPDETGTKWAKSLSFMGDKPDEWGIGFLKECGFLHVEIIGTFSTGLTSTDRYLFFAKK